MKKLLLMLGCLFVFSSLYTQTKDEKWNLGIYGGLTQYSGDLGQGFYNFDQAAYGHAGLSLSRYLNQRFDAVFMLTRGQVGYLAPRNFEENQTADYNFRNNISTANVFLRYNIRSKDYNFVPFVFLGAGIIKQATTRENHLSFRKKSDFALPAAGIGFMYQFNPYIAAQFQETFMYTSSDREDFRVEATNDMYLMHSIGLTLNLFWHKKLDRFSAGKTIAKCPDMKTGTEIKLGEGKAKLKPKKKKKQDNVKLKN